MRHPQTLIYAAALLVATTKLPAQAAPSGPATPPVPAAAAAAQAPAQPQERPLPPALVGVITQEEFNSFNAWQREMMSTPEYLALKQKNEDLRKQQIQIAEEGRALREKQLNANPEQKAIYDKVSAAYKAYNLKMHPPRAAAPAPAAAGGAPVIVVPKPATSQ